jgi:hypothetical protein
MTLSAEKIQRIAGFELNALRVAEVLGEEFEKVRVPRTGTRIYDISGVLLFYRLPLKRGRTPSGYVDIAADEALAEPLLAIATGGTWDEKALLEEGAAIARKGRRGFKYDSMRFVAYSFPKIALQFLLAGKEVLLVELYTWTEVPPARPQERRPFEPSNFERWSLLDELPEEMRRTRARNFRKRIALWEAPALSGIDPAVITKAIFDVVKVVVRLNDTRDVHYAPRAADHDPCYELRGQQTSVWCVAASVEMLLDFYRYHYDQPRLALEMQLGTCASPNGLPYGEEHRVVDTIKKLSSNTLDAAAIANPAWATFQTEIQANRPLISFIPGHSRTVAGYTRSMIWLLRKVPFEGLLVYDPWPPTDCDHPEAGGVITKWENFATQSYRYAFTAVLKHV